LGALLAHPDAVQATLSNSLAGPHPLPLGGVGRNRLAVVCCDLAVAAVLPAIAIARVVDDVVERRLVHLGATV
jgi:hypothetical protein